MRCADRKTLAIMSRGGGTRGENYRLLVTKTYIVVTSAIEIIGFFFSEGKKNIVFNDSLKYYEIHFSGGGGSFLRTKKLPAR